jgi:hypothetical protein
MRCPFVALELGKIMSHLILNYSILITHGTTKYSLSHAPNHENIWVYTCNIHWILVKSLEIGSWTMLKYFYLLPKFIAKYGQQCFKQDATRKSWTCNDIYFYMIFTMSWICTLVWSTNDLGTFQPTSCFKHTQMLIIWYFTFHWYLPISNLISMLIPHTYNKKLMMGLSHHNTIAFDATCMKNDKNVLW